MRKKKVIWWPTSNMNLTTAKHIQEHYKGFGLRDHLTMLECVIFISFFIYAIDNYQMSDNTKMFLYVLTCTCFIAGLGFLFVHWQLWLWYHCAMKVINRFEKQRNS